MPPVLQSNIEYLKGVGPQRGELLRKEFDIHTFGDLLKYYPFRYVDRSVIHKVKDITPLTQYIQLKGHINGFRMLGEKRHRRLIASFVDDTGEMDLVWFQGADWILKSLKPGVEYLVFGKPNLFNGEYNMPHPEVEIFTEEIKAEGKGLQPVYSSSEKARKKGLDSRGIMRLTRTLVDQLKEHDLPEFIPTEILVRYKLTSRYPAMINIHFPKSELLLNEATRRLKFEELFLIQLQMLKVKSNRGEVSKGFVFEKIDGKFDLFYKQNLKFELTGAQKRVLKEIRKDTLSGRQMNRLLQGDVGSGKTVVALLTMLMAIDNGYQACMMAPTEILATQHYESLTEALKGLGVEVALLTGSIKGKARKYILENLAEGKIDIVLGTHALIEDGVVFKNLGMVVIDEQHRFGVAQRAQLWTKNANPPHILVMTATPIPRTLAMTTYGDLDVSVINELPPGRKPIKTIHRTDSARSQLFGFLKEEIGKGRQVYIVYPLIEESEALDLKHLMDGYESISRAFPMPHYKLSIVHGRMRPADKDYEMQRFVKGDTQIMVATTVIEVGVNVPNASVMVIENAERFGLAQLHQLRGRVGRGADQSYCILMTGNKLSNESKQRISVMCHTNDGFVIAEEDLKLRGPGDIEGTRQSGNINLRIADLIADGRILEVARETAQELIDSDPWLSKPEHHALLKFVEETSKDKIWAKIS
ncbi:MAG TPA: ATP-dependent DNA helicase RecG [Chitinophagales bacterium]|nr:ATP-dependent DNA helicase RecG [Chitinophagales bacterium]